MTFTSFMEELDCSLKNLTVVVSGEGIYNGENDKIGHFVNVLVKYQNYNVIGFIQDMLTDDIVIFIAE